MAQLFEDFLNELIERGDISVVDRIPGYVQSHIVQFRRGASEERDRVANVVADSGTATELRRKVVELIRLQNA